MCDKLFAPSKVKQWFASITSPAKKNTLNHESDLAKCSERDDVSETSDDPTIGLDAAALGVSIPAGARGSKDDDMPDATFVSSDNHLEDSGIESIKKDYEITDESDYEPEDIPEQNVANHDHPVESTHVANIGQSPIGCNAEPAAHIPAATQPPCSIKIDPRPQLAPTQDKAVDSPLQSLATVSILFKFQKGSDREHLRTEDERSISLYASPKDLVATVRDSCNRTCRGKYTNLLRALLQKGLDLNMDAYIAFGDGRDDFMNMDLGGRFRWSRVSDLFARDVSKSEHFVIPVKVKVTIIEKETPLPNHDGFDRWKEHRLAYRPLMGRLPSANSTGHLHMSNGLLVHFMDGDIDTSYNVSVFERKFSATCPTYIGDPRSHNQTPDQLYAIPLEERNPCYRSTDEGENYKRLVYNISTLAKRGWADLRLPVLPDLTYEPIVHKSQTQKVDGVVHLAVRLVNRLANTQFRDVALPANVLINAKTSADAPFLRKIISGALKEIVDRQSEGFDWQPGSPFSLTRLFDPDAVDCWNIDIWVMPQANEVGKYRRLARKGGAATTLKGFLDPEMIKSGDRNIWVEAHLLGTKDPDDF